jgi:hypothetical protein
MKSDLTKITLEAGPEGQEVDFYVLEQTRIAGRDYLLVTDAEDGDGDAYILEDISADVEKDALYEFVEDDERLEALSKVFTQMLDDIALV